MFFLENPLLRETKPGSWALKQGSRLQSDLSACPVDSSGDVLASVCDEVHNIFPDIFRPGILQDIKAGTGTRKHEP